MNTTQSVFSNIRVRLTTSADKHKGMASVLVGNAMMVVGIRIVEGRSGLFVSMPQKKNNTTGDYVDVAFPISKEMRMELSKLILDEFEHLSTSTATKEG